jgi:hypothetical protein
MVVVRIAEKRDLHDEADGRTEVVESERAGEPVAVAGPAGQVGQRRFDLFIG